jgi:hypothetical protein
MRLLIAAALAGAIQHGAAVGSADPIVDSWQTTCDVLGHKFTGDPQHDADTYVRVVEGIQHRYVLSYDAGVIVMENSRCSSTASR